MGRANQHLLSRPTDTAMPCSSGTLLSHTRRGTGIPCAEGTILLVLPLNYPPHLCWFVEGRDNIVREHILGRRGLWCKELKRRLGWQMRCPMFTP